MMLGLTKKTIIKLDQQLSTLPLTKSNPDALLSLFGNKELTPMWIADMEFEIAKPIQAALIKRITNSGFAYENKPSSFFEAQQKWCQRKYIIVRE
jgi:cystathionine beta-lyase